MFEHTPAHIGWIFLAAVIVSVALADVEKNRLIGCCRWHAGSTSAWITAAHGSESLL
jgi:hypothetical protein